MTYWLARGVAGFRIDMAYSLVKDDPDFAATVALWADLRAWVQVRYPDAVLLPENDYRLAPGMGARAGFDADFFLVWEHEAGSGGRRLVVLPTADHDFSGWPRPRARPRSCAPPPQPRSWPAATRSSTLAATATSSSSTRPGPPAPRTSRPWPHAPPGPSKRAGPPSRADAWKRGLSDTAFSPSNPP
jgi:hypothetical protein